jgi:hypothetical protein
MKTYFDKTTYTPPAPGTFAFVIVSEFAGEDLEIKCYQTLSEIEDFVHDILMFEPRRVRVYRVYADEEGLSVGAQGDRVQQLSERVERFDFDEALATA